MDLLKKNLGAFLKRYPELGESIDRELVVQSVTTLQLKKSDKGFDEFYEGGKKIDSLDPEFFPEIRKRDIPGRLLMLEGLGIGAGLERAKKYAHVKNPDIVIVEPSLARFIFALRSFDLSADFENPRMHWIVGRSPEASFTYFGRLGRTPRIAFMIEARQIVRHPVLSDLYSGYFDAVWDEFESARKQYHMLYGSPEDSLMGVRNVIENLDFISKAPGVNQLKGKFKGIPAIVIATGPSLDASIPQLKELSKKALLIAADASLSILLDRGVEPHFVLSLERDLGSKPFFEKACAGNRVPRTELIAYPLVPAEVLAPYRGPKRVMFRDYGWFQLMEEKISRGIIPSYSSVTHLGCQLAEYFGCSTVALVGQDLAFNPDTLSSHASGVAYSEWNTKRTEQELAKEIDARGEGELIWVEGNLREKVPTSTVYYSFVKQFGLLASQLSIPIVNCTEGGAKIPLLAWQTLASWTKDWLNVGDLWSRIEGARKVDDQNIDLSDIDEYAQQMMDRFQHLLETFRAIMDNDTLNRTKKMEILKTVRKSLHDTLMDPRFICWIVQNAGSRMVTLENQLACIYEDDPASMEKQAAAVRDWLAHLIYVSERLHHAFVHGKQARQKWATAV